MSKQTQIELFMRILMEELEAHRVFAKSDFSRKFKAQARQFQRRGRPAPDPEIEPTEPTDCLNMMSIPLASRSS